MAVSLMKTGQMTISQMTISQMTISQMTISPYGNTSDDNKSSWQIHLMTIRPYGNTSDDNKSHEKKYHGYRFRDNKCSDNKHSVSEFDFHRNK